MFKVKRVASEVQGKHCSTIWADEKDADPWTYECIPDYGHYQDYCEEARRCADLPFETSASVAAEYPDMRTDPAAAKWSVKISPRERRMTIVIPKFTARVYRSTEQLDVLRLSGTSDGRKLNSNRRVSAPIRMQAAVNWENSALDITGILHGGTTTVDFHIARPGMLHRETTDPRLVRFPDGAVIAVEAQIVSGKLA